MSAQQQIDENPPPPTNINKHNAEIIKRLRPFQLAAYNQATTSPINGRLLLADEMGLGKTITSLAIMSHYYGEWPLLIICPASLRFTWASEVEKFFPLLNPSSLYCVQGLTDTKFLHNSSLKVLILTYSLLRNDSVVCAKIKELETPFKAIICDESHNLKEKTSQRCTHITPILKSATRLMMLSGTPALARPVELWFQVYSLNASLFGKYTPFTKEFCNAHQGRFGWDVKGCSNSSALNKKLNTIMIRRLKADVLKDLPEKQRSVISVTLGKKKLKDCKAGISQLNGTRKSLEELCGAEAAEANFDARRFLMEAYKNTGCAKANSCADVLEVSERSKRALRKTRATTKLTLFQLNYIHFAHSPPPCSIKNAPRFARCRTGSTVRLGSV